MKPIMEYTESGTKKIQVYKGLEICQYIVKQSDGPHFGFKEIARFAYEKDLIQYLARRLEKK